MMDFPSPFKKTFNKSSSHGSSSSSSYNKQKHIRKISAGGDDISYQEEQPILSHQNMDNCREVIVKIDPSNNNNDNENNKIWRENSYQFWTDDRRRHDEKNYDFTPEENYDPPSKLIGQFIDKQRASGTKEMPFDFDFNNDNINHNKIKTNNTEHRKVPSKDIRVSFQSPSSENDSDHETSEEEDEIREMRSNQNSNLYPNSGGGGEVLKCTSFQRRQSILRTKTRSRLMDPHEPEQSRVSGKVNNKSGQVKSSMLNRVSGMLKPTPTDPEEEDDPLLDDDIPDEYRKGNLNSLTILQWVSLVLIVAALICTLAIRKWKTFAFKGLRLWKWEVLILVLICGRLVSGWGIRFAVFFIERNFLLRKRVLYFVYGVRKAVQNCIWLGLVLLAWHFLFDKRIEKETHTQFLTYVNKLLLCFLVGSLLWLVKTLMVKVLASSFHVSTFFDRIQESLYNQYVIETLSGPPVIEMQNIQDDEDRTMADIRQLQSMGINVPPELKATAFTTNRKSGGLQRPAARTLSKKFSRVGSSRNGSSHNNNNNNNKDKQEQGIPIDDLHRWNPKNISAWNMKRLMKIVRHGVLSTLDEQIHESTNGDESSKQIRSEIEAKAAARKIFQNVARRGSKYIYLLDLMRFMREDEALKTIALLSGSPESEKISKYALKNWVVNAFRERKALALTLNDTKTAVNKLHHMVNILVVIIIVVVDCLILGFATSKFLLFLSSQIVVVAFVFGNTCKTVFEAIVFLFVMHPFDVGDRCEIDGVQMIVEEMNILSTIFLRFDNQKIFYPNSTLSTKCIGNYYRSPDMGDSVDFYVHITTPAEKIATMRQKILSYIENKKDYWYSTPSVVLMNVENLQMVKMSVWMRHRMNHQDMGEKWSRRALLVEEMIKIFKENDMEYRLHPSDINVRTMPTLTTSRTPSTWIPDK